MYHHGRPQHRAQHNSSIVVLYRQTHEIIISGVALRSLPFITRHVTLSFKPQQVETNKQSRDKQQFLRSLDCTRHKPGMSNPISRGSSLSRCSRKSRRIRSSNCIISPLPMPSPSMGCATSPSDASASAQPAKYGCRSASAAVMRRAGLKQSMWDSRSSSASLSSPGRAFCLRCDCRRLGRRLDAHMKRDRT